MFRESRQADIRLAATPNATPSATEEALAASEGSYNRYRFRARPANDRLIKQVDGTWNLRTTRGTILSLTLNDGEGKLQEQFVETGEGVTTEQSIIANRVNEEVLVIGFGTHLVGYYKQQHKYHSSMLRFTAKDNAFQVFWRYADSDDPWTPAEVQSHEAY